MATAHALESTNQSKPLIAVLDYGIGNLASAQKSLSRVGANAKLTNDPKTINQACGIVLPGVGAFGPAMRALRAANLDEIAKERITAGVPFFGICIGMHMLCRASQESPGVDGLGVLECEVTLLPSSVKCPQIQWNKLFLSGSHPMFYGLGDEVWVYFVHSYSPPIDDDVVATCDYGGPIVAAMARENVWAAQFHPEKSSDAGLAILANFVSFAKQWAEAN